MPLKVEAGEVIRRALDSRVQDIQTSFPARVISYDAATQTAELEPQIRRPIPAEDGSIETEDLPPLTNVPIQFPRGGGDAYAITWPIAAGDFVWVHVTTNAIGNWRRTGEASDPGDVRAHGLGSCFAVPGASPNSKVLAQASDNALVLEAPLIKAGKDATDFLGLAGKIMANFNALKTAISGAMTGDAIPAAVGAVNFQDVAAPKIKG